MSINNIYGQLYRNFMPVKYGTNPVIKGVTIPIKQNSQTGNLLILYSNYLYVKNLIEKNPKIEQILSSKGLETEIYPENIKNICNSHITTTTYYAEIIAKEMNISEKDRKILEQACIFHDLGKILIPSEIIQKPAALTDKEKEIVGLHAQLGYELLCNTNVNNKVLELIKNHHNPITENTDVLGRILSVADIYSALREARSYKKGLSQPEALYLLDQKAIKGEVSTEVVNALKRALASENQQ